MKTLSKKIVLIILTALTLACAIGCLSMFNLTKTNMTVATNDYSDAVTLTDTGSADTYYFLSSKVSINEPTNPSFKYGTFEFDTDVNSDSQQFSLTRIGARDRYFTFAATTEGVTKTDNGDGWYHYSVDFSKVSVSGAIGGIRKYSGVSSLKVANAKIVNTLEQEITNNGEFAIGKGSLSAVTDSEVTYLTAEEAAALGVVGTGAVLKADLISGNYGGFVIDFSNGSIDPTCVKGITLRIYAPQFDNTKDEFRTYRMKNSGWVQYGKTTYAFNEGWVDVTLNDTSMTCYREQGYKIWVGIRNSGSTPCFYVDSITVEQYPEVEAGIDQVGPWGWNNNPATVVTPENSGATLTLLTFLDKNGNQIKANPTDSDSFNYASFANSISLGMTYNGTSFYELYKTDTKYAIHSSKNYLIFEIPSSAVVDNAVIEIAKGTKYKGFIYDYVKLVNVSGAWTLATRYNDINVTGFFDAAAYNNKIFSEPNYSVFLTLDTTDLASGAQVFPKSFSGVTINGESLAGMILWNNNILWLSYTPAQMVANYKGYSHPTITFKDAVIVNQNDKTYEINDYEIYLNLDTNLWQRVKPDGYSFAPQVICKPWFAADYGTDQYGLGVTSNVNNGTTVNEFPKAISGFYYNGDELTTSNMVLWNVDRPVAGVDILFLVPKANLVNGYNNYSHPTIEVKEGATITTANNVSITYGATKMYYNESAWSTTAPANYVDGAMIKELTNNGQFTITGKDTKNAGACIDGGTSTLEWLDASSNSTLANAGATGTVLKITNTNASGYKYITVDATASNIDLSNVKSVTVRCWVENGTTGDVFMTNGYTGNEYAAYNISQGFTDVVLTKQSLLNWANNEGTNVEGKLGKIVIDARLTSGATNFYIDSIVIEQYDSVNVVLDTVNIGPWTWNNNTAFTGTLSTILLFLDPNNTSTRIDPTVDNFNLAQFKNPLSLGLTYNGVSFYELYKTNDKYIINSQQNYFMFQIPSDALAGGNGYSVPTIECVGNVKFQNLVLPHFKLECYNNVWGLGANYEPSFVKVASDANRFDAGAVELTQMQFDTNAFIVPAVGTNQHNVEAFSGITVNGEPVGEVRIVGANKINFVHSKAKEVAGYNDYSHATFEIAEGATITNEGRVFTFHAQTLYCVDGKWTTTKPDGYIVGNFTPSFVEVAGTANRVIANSWEITQIVFDTNSFIIPAIGKDTHNVEAFSGITVNGEPVGEVRIVGKNIINFLYPHAKEVAWSNGYSHATFEIAEGATITNEGRVFTFHAQTLYVDYDTEKWTTTQPSGYVVVTTTSTFDSIDSSSTATSLVLKYTDNATWVNNLGNLANNVLLDGNAFNGTISVNTTNKTITFNLVSSVSTLSINAESVCGGVYIPTKTFFFYNDAWSLHHAPTVTMTADGVGPWGWNNADSSVNGVIPVGATWTIIPFSCGNFVSDATNLVATDSEVASMIKFNGVTFGELYASNNLYAVTTNILCHMIFQIPIADLVAGNGYDYPTVEIEAGLPVQGQYLPEVTVVLINGVWMEKPNYEPTMTAFTEMDAGTLFVLYVDFDTKNFVVPQEKTTRNVLASNGFTFNGEEIYDVRTIEKNRIWFVENKTKRVADYNGYSHPTFEIAEGATLTDSANNVFTFHALTLYYVDGAWTTVKPNGYYTSIALLGVDEVYNNNRESEDGYSYTILNFAEELGAWTGNNIKDNFTLNGSALPNDAVVQVGYNGTQLDKLWIKIPNSSLTTADATSHLTTLRWNSFTLENGNIFTGNLFLVDGEWVTQASKTYVTVSYEDRGNGSGTNGLLWNNHDYGDASAGKNPVYVDLGVELGAVFLLNVSAYPLIYQSETDPRINLISDTNDVGNRIWLNGKAKLKDVPNAGCTIAVGFLYFNVPTYVEYIEIEAGTVIGNYVMEHTIIYYGSAWSLTPTVYTPVSYDATTELYGMAWNNYDYNGYDLPYGETMTGTPSNGVAGLLKFDQFYFTDARYANMANEFTDVGSKMKFGGIAVKDIPGAYVACPAAGQFLYFYIPHSGLEAVGVDYSWFTLTLETCHVYNMEIPGTVYYFYDTQFHDQPATQVNLSYNGDTMSKRLNGETTIDFDYIQDMLSTLYSDLKPFVWTYNEIPYTANTPFVVDGTVDINITLNQVVGIETDVGAAVRLDVGDGQTGLGFTTRIQNDTLTFLCNTYGVGNIEIGTLIAPRQYIDAYLADKDTTDKSIKGFISDINNVGQFILVQNTWSTEGNPWGLDIGMINRDTFITDGYVSYRASLDVLVANYNTEFYGVGYIKVTANGTPFYVFGSNVINANTRTIYKVAKAAYLDTSATYKDTDKALTALEGYLDRVIDINLINGVASLANDFSSVYPERNYTQAYATEYNNGVLYVTNFKKNADGNYSNAARTYILNGQRLSVKDSPTDPSGSETPWSFAVYAATISEYLKTVNYGIGEPSRNVWTTGHEAGDPNTTQAMLAEVVGKNGFGATAFRVWMNAGLPKVGAENAVTLGQSETDDLELMLEELVKNNVKEIYLQMSLAPASTYPINYAQNKTTKQYEWVTADKINDTHYAPIYMDNNTVPYWETNTLNADDSPEAYSDWLTVQYKYFKLLTEQLSEWANEKNWSGVKIIFEGVNEPEGEHPAHRRGQYNVSSLTYSYAYFDNEQLARVLTDVSYYNTLAIKNTTFDTDKLVMKVATPALTDLWLGQASTVMASGVYADSLAREMTNAIKDDVAPTAIDGITPANSNNPSDYYTVLNWHPYISWLKEDNNYLYYGEIKETTKWFKKVKEPVYNANYISNWKTWNLAMYNLLTDGFTDYAPDVVFTELGAFDFGTHPTDKLKTLGINNSVVADTIINGLIKAIPEIGFKGSTTVIYFRLCDMETQYTQEGHGTPGNPDYFATAEGNAGLLEENGQLKTSAIAYYELINGNKNTTALQAIINKYWNK